MTRLRPALALLLSLTIGLTSVALAAARGRPPAAGQIEICSGLGLQVITVDADGNPTGPPHVCPDAVAAFVSVDLPPPPAPERPSRCALLRPPACIDKAGRARPHASARAPPPPV